MTSTIYHINLLLKQPNKVVLVLLLFRVLTGMIIASLCWKNNEWVGLTMACAMSELLGDLEGILLDLPDAYKTSLVQNYSLGKWHN